ncbi:15596_t:CDS:2 [Gigaspora margarita]|uniref:15596_t:CDS:1 n=1 Tax=Gigaspora margarita TaxID=4874 RepID=A0ABN7V4U9_GIGMA|nr:15596_t:CDS:2 [Gigaspora margarita]
MSEELAQEDDYDLDNISHALESLGYEQMKYRNSTRDHSENERLRGDGTAIFDIGDEHDGEWDDDDESSSRRGSSGNYEAPSRREEESTHVEQEISKIN